MIDLSPGDRLGPYEILAPLGQGGMGVVYKARDTRLGRTVAVKRLKGPHLERFRREARAIASLNHPRVCALHDVGDDYLVLEYVEGKPLRGPLPPEEARRYALQICEALEAAHSKGITHRDLKPANILLTTSGVKLLDFGLATLVRDGTEDTETDLTDPGSFLGTVAFAAPEQIEGRPVDQRADLFSFGGVLYLLLTGRRPFERATRTALITAILRDDPPPLPREVPPGLSAVVQRCLEKEPSRRYVSATELMRALLALESRASEARGSIAVLPFVSLSHEPGADLAEGLAHELVNTLARVGELRVAAFGAAFRFRGPDRDVKEIGRQLGVHHVLEGALQVEGDRLRVTAELVHAADGYVLWSGRIDRDIKGVLDVQEEVSRSIVTALTDRHRPSPSLPALRPTQNMAAYDAYLRGNYLLQRLTPSEIRRGAALLEEAAQLDAGFALPLVGLSTHQSMLAIQGLARPLDALPRAEALAHEALRIDESLPEAHRAHGLARLFRWDWGDAEAACRRALALEPRHSPALALVALAASLRGAAEEAVDCCARALELSPLESSYGRLMTQALCCAGHVERAIAQGEATIRLDPDYMPTYWWHATAQWLAGRREDAVATIECKLSSADCYGRGLHASFAAQVGRTQEARAAAEKLDAAWRAGTASGVTGAAVATAWTGLGEVAQALGVLEDACRNGCASLVLLGAPWFDSLRAEPRFKVLLEQVGLQRRPS